MTIAIRQIALVARELDPVVEDLCAVLGIEVCYNDPGVAAEAMRSVRALPSTDNLFTPTLISLLGNRQLKSGGREGDISRPVPRHFS